MKLMTQVILCGLLATTMFAQGFGLPPGKWWKMPRVVETLELTKAQQDQLDDVFRTAAPDLIDLKAELEKATIALRDTVDQADINREGVRGAVSRVNSARAKMFEREVMLLVDMRGVLSAPQWSRLRQALDQRRVETKREDRRPANRRRP